VETAAAWKQPPQGDSRRKETAPAGRQQQQRVIAALTWLLAANGTSPG
jgi:hypothetical protein